MTIETPPPQGDKGAPAWHDPTHAQLVETKSWKGWNDTVRDYAQLETFVGATPDRLIKLPAADKIDDAFRTDVFKRIGYNPNRGPAKPEDYGVQFEGAPPEFATGLAAIAHKHGIPKEALAELAEFNTKFGKEYGERTAAEAATADAAEKVARDKKWGDLNTASEAKLKERFGAKYDEANEYMVREALRMGIKDGPAFEEFQRDLALSGDGRLDIFRTLLADVAEMRKESPFHRGGNQAGLTQDQALAQLATKRGDAEWVKKATTRGTPEAEENLRLNLISTGATVNEAEIKRMAAGLTPAVVN